jgi:glutaminyl-peptide cyclotransferase
MNIFRRRLAFGFLSFLLAGCAGVGVATQKGTVLTRTRAQVPSVTASVPFPVPMETPASFDGRRAYTDAAAFMAFGPRVSGSEANRRAGDWILAQLQAAGWATFTNEGSAHGVVVRNLAGRKGAGPILILAAHYDSRRRADRDPVATGEPVPGAEDGASGVSVLLECARTLAWDATRRQVWLVFLDAEDNGNLDGWDWAVGAQQFAQFVDRERRSGAEVSAFVLLDMVGDADQHFYYEGNSDPALREQIWGVAAQLGYGAQFIPVVNYTLMDDHVPIRALGIPAVDIIDFDYPYWHTREDTLDKLDAQSLERVGRTLEYWLTGN